MAIKIGVIMDPIETINTEKDTSFALMLAAQQRNWQTFYLQASDLFWQAETVMASMAAIQVKDRKSNYYQLSPSITQALTTLDVILIRKDPPFNMDYIYMTYLLQHVAERGTLVINNPQSIRDANEKLFTTWFPQCCPETIVTAKQQIISDFAKKYGDIVIKPLDGMGGRSVFRTSSNDQNFNVITETLTNCQQQLVMAQRFIPQIKNGDKRLLMINGEPINYVLARIPQKNDFRGNLAAGAHYEGRELDKRDRWIAQQIGPILRKKQLYFVGLDIIGDYLTEINVTSPTCVRELERLYPINICDAFLDFVASSVKSRQ